MKITVGILFPLLILMLLLTACHNNPKSSPQPTTVIKKDNSTYDNGLTNLDSLEASGERIRDTNYTFLGRLLDSALNLSYKQGFNKPYEITVDTNGFRFKNMYATISFGHLFSSDRNHLLVKRFISEYADYETALYSDIYLFESNSFKKVAADTSDIGYYDDHLEDLNHDGWKDFIIQSYSPTGCCPRNAEAGQLYNPKNGHFEPVDFFNREADSLSTVFFEASYGLGVFSNLYKYKWRGLEKVLLEEIFVSKTAEGSFNEHPTSYTKVLYPGERKQKIKKLPKEFARLKMAEYISPLEK